MQSLLIVVPTLDSYLQLSPLVQLLQGQTWKSWNLLFVDGPSSAQHRSWLQECCSADHRFHWVEERASDPGIFGAMNIGFEHGSDFDWLLFWGSDDLPASCTAFEQVFNLLTKNSSLGLYPDLIIARSRYFQPSTGVLGRSSRFSAPALFTSASFRKALFLGSTPPHQATFFGRRARSCLGSYSPDFSLSGDLDCFLRLSSSPHLISLSTDIELVLIGHGGASQKYFWTKTREVIRAYKYAFSCFWPIPFVARYLRRLFSVVAPTLQL